MANRNSKNKYFKNNSQLVVVAKDGNQQLRRGHSCTASKVNDLELNS